MNPVDFMGWHQRERKQELRQRSKNATNLDLIFGELSRTTAVDIQNSDNRKRKKVRGYGKKDVKTFLRKKVAPQVEDETRCNR